MDINMLISEVFARPALWDRKNKNYHNRMLVEHLWESVASEMNLQRELEVPPSLCVPYPPTAIAMNLQLAPAIACNSIEKKIL
nr:uncharacterized protein LOC106627975 isoform X2 [Bactrocera oleae]